MDHTNGEKKSVAVELIGGNGGNVWDDGIYHGVREIAFYYHNCLDWIQVVYDKKGKPVTAEKHGGNDNPGSSDTPNAKIKLRFPEEFLIRVRGHYGLHNGHTVIRSLSFKSNERSFGPYGVEQGTPFTLSLEGVEVVGFKGRCGWHFDAIGFNLAMKEQPKPLQKV